jgi:hypothetical protein
MTTTTANLAAVMVDFNRCVIGTTPYTPRALAEIAGMIRSPELAGVTGSIRQTYFDAMTAAGGEHAAGKRAIEARKRQALPVFVGQGTFADGRRAAQAWLEPSGLVQVDIDGICPTSAESVMDALRQSEHCALAFRSPSGFGVKAFIYAPVGEIPSTERYLFAWEAVSAWCLERLGHKNDPACKDCSRACFLCHDAGVVWRDNPIALDVERWHPGQPEQRPPRTQQQQPRDRSPAGKSLLEVRAWAYISKISSVQGAGGSSGCLSVCRVLWDGYALDDATAWGLLRRWNDTVAEPPWSDAELAHKVQSVQTTPSVRGRGWLLEDHRAGDDAMGVEDESPPYVDEGATAASSEAETAPQPMIVATPYIWRDPAEIPPRRWLYGHSFIREHITVIAAAGGTGKSSKAMVDALAMASGHELLGTPVYDGPHRVWVWNLEDPQDENERRMAAAMIAHGITPDEVEGRLFLDSGRQQGLCLARTGRDGTTVMEPVIDALCAELKRRQIDVLMVDPFVSSHQCSENDNMAIDAVAKAWARVAGATQCSIVLVHHLRKTGDQDASVSDARGAVSLVAAARIVQILNPLSDDQADKWGLDSRHGIFKCEDGKSNLAPRSDAVHWYQMRGVELPNGDHVGVTMRYQPPSIWDGIKPADLARVQKAIAGKGLRESVQSADWVGHEVGVVLNIDVTEPAGRSQVAGLVKGWLESGALKVGITKDAQRRSRRCIDVGNWA